MGRNKTLTQEEQIIQKSKLRQAVEARKRSKVDVKKLTSEQFEKIVDNAYSETLKAEWNSDNCCNCEEKIGKIDISEILDRLANFECEGVALLQIKDGELENTYIFKSSCPYELHASDYMKEGAVSFIKDHYKDSKIYHYHNHPFVYAAIPSKEDIVLPNYKGKIDYSDKPIDKPEPNELLETYLPDGFMFEDMGVVTKGDFVSFQQVGSLYLESIVNEQIKREFESTVESSFFESLGLSDDVDE